MHDGHAQINQHGTDDSACIKTDADGQTNAGGGPQTSCRCQSFDLTASGDDNGTGAEKTDAANHLCPETGGIAGVKNVRHILARAHHKS